MNTITFTTSALTQDPTSRGVSVFENAELTFKKLKRRTNTKPNTASYTEPYQTPRVLPKQVMTDPIPSRPPTDFVSLTNNQIISQFGILSEEISQFNTTLNGHNVFSIQQSTSYPHIYKLNNCKLMPYVSNPDTTFSAMSPISNINLIQNTIPFENEDGAWRGTIKRTTPSGDLSRGGTDIVKETQYSYIFDYDAGFFVGYDQDVSRYGNTPISSTTPPSVTCYIYKGRFGLFSPWLIGSDDRTVYYNKGQVLIGAATSMNPNAALDVLGLSYFEQVVATSVNSLSDVRLKENIVHRDPILDLLNVKTYNYNFKTTPGVKDLGVIAQEVETIVPELVKDQDGVKSVRYDRFGVLLIPVVKHLSERLESVEKENADLKRRLERIEGLLFKVE